MGKEEVKTAAPEPVWHDISNRRENGVVSICDDGAVCVLWIPSNTKIRKALKGPATRWYCHGPRAITKWCSSIEAAKRDYAEGINVRATPIRISKKKA